MTHHPHSVFTQDETDELYDDIEGDDENQRDIRRKVCQAERTKSLYDLSIETVRIGWGKLINRTKDETDGNSIREDTGLL